MDFPVLTKTAAIEKMQRWSGDVRNIHTDPEAAKAWGLGTALVQGGQLVAYLNEFLLRTFRAGYLEGGEINVSFIKPVRPGDTVTAKAESKGESVVGGRRRAELDVWLENQQGEKVTAGKAAAFLP